MSDILEELERHAKRIARKYNLKYSKIKIINPSTVHEGWCTSDGVIGISVIDKFTGKHFLHYRIIDTLCHEMAHLRHLDHGKEFKRFYQQILGYLRGEGVYQPWKRKAA